MMRNRLATHWIGLVLLGAAAAAALGSQLTPDGAREAWLWALPVLALGGLAGVVASVAQAWRRRWTAALSTLAGTLAVGLSGALVLALVVVDAAFFSEDHFADDLTIPEGLALREPVDAAALVDDPEGAAVIAAAGERAQEPSIQVPLAMPSLDALERSQLDALRAYLAASPYWHVGEERGRTYAYRRFAAEDRGGLRDSLNGYYSGPERRSWRVVLGFGGPVFADRFDGRGGHRTSARTGSIALTGGPSSDAFPDPVTHLTLEGRPLVVEVYERGPDEDRAITRAGLALVERTLASFLRGEPLAPAARGEPALDLAHGMQPGIYHLTATLNPGEPGRAYVRAFEVTREVELSASRLRDRTLQTVGSSPDPSELFRYETELTIYEGNWGQHYAARFEVWFVPESGAEERRLIADVFRIEGWMR